MGERGGRPKGAPCAPVLDAGGGLCRAGMPRPFEGVCYAAQASAHMEELVREASEGALVREEVLAAHSAA